MRHFQALLKDKTTGSIAATTNYSARLITQCVDFTRAKVIVEYGPGDGALTRQLLENMRADAVLVAIELSSDFVRILSREVKDPRLHIVNDSADNVGSILQNLGLNRADYIISGVPFSLLHARTTQRIITETKRLLSGSGRFLVYQALTAPLARIRLKRIVGCRFRILQETFLLFNLPPLYLLEMTRGSFQERKQILPISSRPILTSLRLAAKSRRREEAQHIS